MEYAISCLTIALILFIVWKITKNFIKLLICFCILGTLLYFGWPYIQAFM